MASRAALTQKDFASDQDVRWCPGCGDYSILANIQRVMPELGVPHENFVFVSGIGCSSRFPYYMNTYGFHTIHGRAPAFATGIKCAEPELSVWVVTGDGDGLSIGGNHLLHTIRRNVDLQILLFNNRVYGLTKGQYSPTSRVGMRTKSTPDGSIDHPVDPIAFALGSGATFVARAVDVDAQHLQEMLRRAHAHRGTAFIEILQNCPVYNDDEWIEVEDRKQRVEASLKLEDGKPLVYGPSGDVRGIRIEDGIPSVIELRDDQDPVSAGVAVHHDRHESPAYAFALASLRRTKFPIPIGVFRAVEKPTYEALLSGQVAAARTKRGEGDLESLLNSGDTWTVEA
ncbi:MAG: 2-oxoacid:ferredoxin oxidoreductase subunit beta [Myxococcota bacterium]|jgi:2-oxoglutarate ferredoxin oxidoreductase subunit beta|nr:2-oxoacid:ferredoxin oxidoreductase subunit beta [Deltaproteobacteria bacterium]MCP4244131.1 2-oxoacid:ferredoxin oxidoreductase subunit beta [bacterium]MDP6076242.1 2-oxoacid:ferredoxin oxidoreductase subunit beta [Myxococcota bacterium]MDP6244624.1 2-oxoacid:ferredoxin oxidoreductase subunit beta [Myxococcota bacterium]MDP7074948.1 2-oxoacid:ferredoxin oxidoreductase subunit beta [Myxococcota bacterium]